MAGLNEVRLLGNLGDDPDLRMTQTGTPVATLSIATNRTWLDKNNEKQEDTQWHRVVVWGAQAESVCANKRKGDQLLICGRLQTRKYQDKDGNDRYQTEVVAEQVIFTGKAPRSGAPHPADDPNAREPARRSNGSQQRRDAGPPDDDFGPPPGDDDIPFDR